EMELFGLSRHFGARQYARQDDSSRCHGPGSNDWRFCLTWRRRALLRMSRTYRENRKANRQ
ncbi:MAG: hypothetical protein WCA36_15015, partial [Pseudolabrys sp.]